MNEGLTMLRIVDASCDSEGKHDAVPNAAARQASAKAAKTAASSHSSNRQSAWHCDAKKKRGSGRGMREKAMREMKEATARDVMRVCSARTLGLH